MNKDEVLIIKSQFPIKPEKADKVYKKLIEQMETGVILIPYGYEVIIAPKDTEIKVEMENKELSSPWAFVDNPNYSPFDSTSKQFNLFCDECGEHIEKWDDFYARCPYCGKKHTFGAVEGIKVHRGYFFKPYEDLKVGETFKLSKEGDKRVFRKEKEGAIQIRDSSGNPCEELGNMIYLYIGCTVYKED